VAAAVVGTVTIVAVLVKMVAGGGVREKKGGEIIHLLLLVRTTTTTTRITTRTTTRFQLSNQISAPDKRILLMQLVKVLALVVKCQKLVVKLVVVVMVRMSTPLPLLRKKECEGGRVCQVLLRGP
jgi:hypothetical protein